MTRVVLHCFSILLFIWTFHGSLGCSSTGSSENNSASFFTTCPSGDVDCFLTAFFLEDENGDFVDLFIITDDLPGKTADGTQPTIAGVPASLTFTSSDDRGDLDISWNDPNGSQPAFCFRYCKPNVQCSSFHLCSRSIPDGLISGVWRTAPYYTAGPAGPAGTTEDSTLEITPISMPSGEDPVAALEEAQEMGTPIDGTMDVGQPKTVDQTLIAPESDGGSGGGGDGGGGGSDGGGGSGDSCTSSSQCGGGVCLSSRNCIPSIFDGTCDCAGTASPGTCYSVSSCSSSGGSCGDGVNACCVGLNCVMTTCEAPGQTCP